MVVGDFAWIFVANAAVLRHRRSISDTSPSPPLPFYLGDTDKLLVLVCICLHLRLHEQPRQVSLELTAVVCAHFFYPRAHSGP